MDSLPREHLSISQMNTFLRCPMQYYFRYERGLVIPPDGGLVRGRAVHKGIEANYAQKVETYEDIPLGDVLEATAAAFEDEEKDAAFRPDESPGELKDSAVSLAKVHRERIQPEVQPVLVEHRIEFGVPGVPVPFVGYVDVVDTSLVVRDNKTASKSPNADAAEKSLQLTGYAYAFQAEHGRLPSAVALDFAVANKVPKAMTVTGVRTHTDMLRFEATARMVTGAILSASYYPNEDGWWCSPRWCGYYETCHNELR